MYRPSGKPPSAESPFFGSLHDVPEAFTVERVRRENYRIKTLIFDRDLPSEPGQFAMLWLPGVNERPISIHRSSPLMLSVADVGEFSSKACALKPGDKVGIRGPYGNHFQLKGREILLVGGGYGLMPLYFLAQKARRQGMRVTVAMGARKANDIVLEKEFESEGCKVHISTDDGSRGAKGYVTKVVAQLLKREKFSAVYGCGPELMEYALVQECRAAKAPVWVSVERKMKCGFGVCGECAFGGKLACAQGTIFSGDELARNPEFGKSFLDWNGSKCGYAYGINGTH